MGAGGREVEHTGRGGRGGDAGEVEHTAGDVGVGWGDVGKNLSLPDTQ